MNFRKFKVVLESTLFQSAGIYTMISVINNAIVFLLVILMRCASPADFGIMSIGRTSEFC